MGEFIKNNYEIDVTKVEYTKRAGGNIRIDLGDIEEMKQSILANGIVEPIKGYRNKDKAGYWLATNGGRRLAAAKELISEGKLKHVPVTIQPIDATKITDAEILYSMFVMNAGKPFNDIEIAEGVKRLTDLGETAKAISMKLGKSLTYIYEMQQFNSYPKKVKEMIANKEVTRTLCVDILKENGGDLEDLEKRLMQAKDLGKTEEELIEERINEPKIKITAKVVSIKKNSYKAAKNALKDINKKNLTIKNKEVYDLIDGIVNNKFDKEYLIALIQF